MEDSRCSELTRLSEAVVRAAQAVFSARYERARAIDAAPYPTLVNAKAAELSAINALEQHRQKHGCKSP